MAVAKNLTLKQTSKPMVDITVTAWHRQRVYETRNANSPRLYIVYERLKVCFCQYIYGTADMARSCLPKEECFFTLTSVDCLDLAVWVTHVSRILKAGIASFQISNFQLDRMHH